MNFGISGMPHLKTPSALFMLLAVLAGLGFALCAGAPALGQRLPETLPLVVDARVLNNAERARLIVDLGGVTLFAIAALDAPDRIVVDLKAKGIATPIATTPAGDGLLKTYAVEGAEAGRVRATLALAAPAQVQQAYLVEPVGSQPARLIVDLIPDTSERFAQQVAGDRAAAAVRQLPAELVDDSAAAGASASTGETTPRARPLIVIDPGHGGVDGGAEAPSGVKEKHIVLKFALELQRLLIKEDRFDIAMTRDGDTFLRLEERVALARANKADLFVSIHADKFEDPEIRGTSIYIRDEHATDELDKVLADGENRADIVAGFAPPDTDRRVTSILLDLMRRETQHQSYLAAEAIIATLEPNIRLRKLPLHKADFFVLQAPEVPSMLIELGFLSNDTDVGNLGQQDWRDLTAAAVAKGIAGYFDGIAQN